MIKTCKGHLDGFQMTFANGWTVSVQVGENNYARKGTAEIAAWDANDEWFYFPEHNGNVAGWQDADEVAAFINKVSKF